MEFPDNPETLRLVAFNNITLHLILDKKYNLISVLNIFHTFSTISNNFCDHYNHSRFFLTVLERVMLYMFKTYGLGSMVRTYVSETSHLFLPFALARKKNSFVSIFFHCCVLSIFLPFFCFVKEDHSLFVFHYPSYFHLEHQQIKQPLFLQLYLFPCGQVLR